MSNKDYEHGKLEGEPIIGPFRKQDLVHTAVIVAGAGIAGGVIGGGLEVFGLIGSHEPASATAGLIFGLPALYVIVLKEPIKTYREVKQAND